MQHLIVVRHGETDHNRLRRVQGRVDIELNAVGREQAKAVGRTLAKEENVVAVYSSPLVRAFETAQNIAGQLGLEVQADDRLVERSFGDWEGLTRDDIKAGWPELFAEWTAERLVDGANVESRHAVAERMDAAFRDMHARHNSGTVVVVSHGAALGIGITAALGLHPEEFRGIRGMDNCHRSLLVTRRETRPGPAGESWMRLASLNVPPDFS